MTRIKKGEKSISQLVQVIESQPEKPPERPAKRDQDEANFLEKEEEIHLDSLKLSNISLKALIKLRKDYSKKVFNFLCCWSGGVGLILMLQGFNSVEFNLPESVLDFLVGSTTANVIA